MLVIVMPEAEHGRTVTGGHHRTVVDRLVRAAIEKDRPLASQHWNHRHVNLRDCWQQQHILATQQRDHFLFDLGIQSGIPE